MRNGEKNGKASLAETIKAARFLIQDCKGDPRYGNAVWVARQALRMADNKRIYTLAERREKAADYMDQAYRILDEVV